jgi:hypothetical protein
MLYPAPDSKTKGDVVRVRLDPQMQAQVQARAGAGGVSKLIRDALAAYLEPQAPVPTQAANGVSASFGNTALRLVGQAVESAGRVQKLELEVQRLTKVVEALNMSVQRLVREIDPEFPGEGGNAK